MNEYYPDRYLILKVTPDDAPVYYRIFATWYGGYLSGDRWRLNSGIKSIDIKSDRAYIESDSGSSYTVPVGEQYYGATAYTGAILDNLTKQAAEMGTKIEIVTLEDVEL